MAIQQRHGANADFDATKMLPGELAVTTDGSRKVYVAFAPGDAKELASAEEVEESIQNGIEEIEQKKEESIQNGIEEIEQKKEEALAQFPNYEDKITELEIYKANSIIATSTGTTFHETDCAAVSPVNIKLFGKGKQPYYEGKQLIDISSFESVTVQGVEWTNNGDGSISAKGTSTAESQVVIWNGMLDTGEYIVSGCPSGGSSSTYMVQLTDFPIVNSHEICYGDEVTKTLESGDYAVRLRIVAGNTVDVTFYPMIRLATFVDGTWEPYVGGEASPNMNYPQIPEFLGESGSIVGKVLSRNLFDDVTYFESQGFTQNVDYWEGTGASRLLYTNYKGIKGSLVIEYDYMSLASVNVFIMEIHYTDGTQDLIGQWKQNEWVHNKITTDTTKTVDCIYRTYVDNGDFYVKNFTISTDGTSYEPYTEQPFTALTPNGLPGIPLGATIPDAIKKSPIHMSGVYWDEAEQQYYIADYRDYATGKDIKLIAEFTIDGGEENGQGWWAYTSYNGFARSVLPFIGDRRDGFCNQASVRSNRNGLMSQNGIWIGVNNNVIYLIHNSFFDSTLDDYGVANLKVHLDENPLVITTWLDEPIITDLTEEELAEYNALVMNYPNTTIVNDAGAYMEVTHVKDTQKHIEQNYVSKAMHEEHESRIAELEKAIVNS